MHMHVTSQNKTCFPCECAQAWALHAFNTAALYLFVHDDGSQQAVHRRRQLRLTCIAPASKE